MRSLVVTRLFVLCALVALPGVGYAQEAILSGAVTDSTAAVLPGVTVVAVHQASGNRFEAVTDEAGRYRIPARIGAYEITAELAGFTTVTRSNIQLQVGQTAVVNLQMAPSTIAGVDHRHRRGAAARRRAVQPRRQHRLEPDVGAAGAGARLDGARAARARQPDRRAMGADAGAGPRASARVPAEHGRPAGARQNIGTGGQPLYSRDCDRRVPVHLEPLRRDAGALVGRAGQRGDQVGNQ